jgi:hypothetical protein
VTRWPARRHPAPEEPPAWVRVFVVEDWRDPDDDATWAAASPWAAEHAPAQLQGALDWRAKRRWVTQRNEWYRTHPAAAAVWLREVIASLGTPE